VTSPADGRPGGGLFVTLEGGEGAGKTTQLESLARLLIDDGRRLVTCREPGGTALGERLRAALFADAEHPPAPEAELLIFAAARAQLVAEVIRPGLHSGAVVLCDRYADSTVAYQHYGRGLDLDAVRAANDVATAGLFPDLTLLFDIDPIEGLRREGRSDDYIEREDLAFHRRVRLGYLELAAAEPQRWLVLDATRPAMQVTHAAWQRIAALLPARAE
jgi:dTMP kinase